MEPKHLYNTKIDDHNETAPSATEPTDAVVGHETGRPIAHTALHEQASSTEMSLNQIESNGTTPLETLDPIHALAYEKELLLRQLHLLQQELERYYFLNRQLRKKTFRTGAYPMGAAERIKRQLSYRLGATMIAHSKSFFGWISMPFALLLEVFAFRRERARRADEKLPPIHTYGDADEALRVKQHLSYKLGSTLLAHSKSPIGLIKLPFALLAEVKKHRSKYRASTPSSKTTI